MDEIEPAFEFIPGDDRVPLLFLCDHASNALPRAYGNLGLPHEELTRHIAWDIGAAVLTRRLAAEFGAAAFLSAWSRLLVDLNRGPDDPTIVMKISDGAAIPGNAKADEAEIARRIEHYHAPYHAAVKAAIDVRMDAGYAPSLISMHSFTPSWKSVPRPWHVGVLWDRDDRIAAPLIRAFEAEPGLVVGDNQPYAGALEGDTLWTHGTSRGLPHVLIEIRQDLLADEAGIEAATKLVSRALRRAMGEADLGLV